FFQSFAQTSALGSGAQSMPGVEHMDHGSGDQDSVMYLMKNASGTSMNPWSWPMPMLMAMPGSWQLMFMGQAFLVDTQQSGPRGADKFFSTNWFMGSAEHSLAGGSV